MSPASRLAAVVSWVGHPLVFVTGCVGVVVLTQLSPGAAMPILAVLFLSVIVPTGILLFLGVRSGRWRDADVSVREERTRFYPIAIPISAIGTMLTWLVGAPGYILRGGVVTMLLLVAAAIANRWFKISLHTLFASYCTVILFRVNVIVGLASLILAALVFWGRLFLARHTFAETLGGTLAGVAGGIVTAWLSI